MNAKVLIIAAMLVLLIGAFSYFQLSEVTSSGEAEKVEHQWYIEAKDFIEESDNDKSKGLQEAIDFAVDSNIGKVKLLGNATYTLNSGLLLKEGVALVLGENTRLSVEGDFRVIEMEENSSLSNGFIEINTEEFSSEVIYLDGRSQFWSWGKTKVENVALINTTGTNQGTGLSLHSQEADHYVSFVNFNNINIVGFETGIRLQADNPDEEEGYSWVNGNRFHNITLDSCVYCIELNSSVTIPDEVTGNSFQGLQVQLSDITEKVLSISGSDNRFEGVIWDVHLIEQEEAVIEFTQDSYQNKLSSNMRDGYIEDNGESNYSISPGENGDTN
ncbi:hypothetical protein [Thalassobacillus sp. C254]|uniref:hypothetical protein n=1 Tax=Thalassobacillus sp. C254 TaxID=1225341 RepID=UPI0006D2A96E|nr:hypothetical protein [Thalassobacillus sp. C254]